MKWAVVGILAWVAGVKAAGGPLNTTVSGNLSTTSTRSLTLSTSFTFTTSSSSSGGLGGYIMSGLGATPSVEPFLSGRSSSSSLSSSLSSSVARNATSTTNSTTSMPRITTPPNSTELEAGISCSNAFISWSQASGSWATGDASYVPTRTIYSMQTMTTTLYVKDIPWTTLCDRRPRVMTSTYDPPLTTTIVTPYNTTMDYYTGFKDTDSTTFPTPKPTCSIPYNVCSVLEMSRANAYASSTSGSNVTLWVPPCSVDQAWYSTRTSNIPIPTVPTALSSTDRGGYCTIYGGRVELLYFPVPTTASRDECASCPPEGCYPTQSYCYVGPNPAMGRPPTSTRKRDVAPQTPYPNNGTTVFSSGAPMVTGKPSVVVVNGTTFTSGYVYISFDKAYAINELSQTVGGVHSGGLVSMASSELSTIRGNRGCSAYTFNYADLNEPVPWSAYGGMPQCATQYCNLYGGDCCATITSGAYKPILAVPTAIRNLDPAWGNCALDMSGLYDPPHPITTQEMLIPTTTSADPQSTPSPVSATATTTDGSFIVPEIPHLESSIVPTTSIGTVTGTQYKAHTESTVVPSGPSQNPKLPQSTAPAYAHTEMSVSPTSAEMSHTESPSTVAPTPPLITLPPYTLFTPHVESSVVPSTPGPRSSGGIGEVISSLATAHIETSVYFPPTLSAHVESSVTDAASPPGNANTRVGHVEDSATPSSTPSITAITLAYPHIEASATQSSVSLVVPSAHVESSVSAAQQQANTSPDLGGIISSIYSENPFPVLSAHVESSVRNDVGPTSAVHWIDTASGGITITQPAQQAQQPTPIITLGGSPVDITPTNVQTVVNGQTTTAPAYIVGGSTVQAGQTVTINNTPFAVPTANAQNPSPLVVVGGSTYMVPGAAITPGPNQNQNTPIVAAIPFGSQTLPATPTVITTNINGAQSTLPAVIVNGQTVTPGQTVTISGTPFAIPAAATGSTAPTAVVVGSTTYALPAAQTGAGAPTAIIASVTAGTQILGATQTMLSTTINGVATTVPALVVGTQTILPGQTSTINGTPFAVPSSTGTGLPSVVVIGSSTLTLPSASGANPTLVAPGITAVAGTGAASKSVVVVDGKTITLGQSITLGSGLSTTVVKATTDSQGHTVLVIGGSSSVTLSGASVTTSSASGSSVSSKSSTSVLTTGNLAAASTSRTSTAGAAAATEGNALGKGGAQFAAVLLGVGLLAL